jgi:hypothetical protein
MGTKSQTEAKQIAKPQKSQKKTAKKAEETKVQQGSGTNEPLNPEQTVMIYACKHPEVDQAVVSACKAANVELVRLEDRVITDYLASKQAVTEREKEADRMQKFLQDESNRQFAEQQGVRLFTIVTGETDVAKSEEIEITENEVCHKTTLSHKQAHRLFDVLRAFGILEFTGIRKFKLHFSAERRHKTILAEVEAVSKILKSDIMRLRNSLSAEDSISVETREQYEQAIRAAVDEALK